MKKKKKTKNQKIPILNIDDLDKSFKINKIFTKV